MKIALVMSPFGVLPPDAIGAVEKLFYGLAGEWRAEGNTVTFYCMGGGEPSKFNYVYTRGYLRSRFFIVDLIKDFIYSLRTLVRLKSTDILLLNTFWSPFLVRFFRTKYKKVIYGVHRFPKGQFWLYKNVDFFIPVSTVVKNALINQNPEYAGKVESIANPIDCSTFNCAGQPIREQAKIIIYSGRIHPEKGVDILVQAYVALMEKYPKLLLRLIGPGASSEGGGGDAYLSYLKGLARGFEIQFVPPVRSPAELTHQLRMGDIYCYPSVATYGESFGVAPLEAMAVGLPTVLSNLPCFSDYAIPEKNVLVFNREVDPVGELTHQLERLILDAKLCSSLSCEAAKTALRFSMPIIAKRYLDCFERILSGHVTSCSS